MGIGIVPAGALAASIEAGMECRWVALEKGAVGPVDVDVPADGRAPAPGVEECDGDGEDGRLGGARRPVAIEEAATDAMVFVFVFVVVEEPLFMPLDSSRLTPAKEGKAEAGRGGKMD